MNISTGKRKGRKKGGGTNLQFTTGEWYDACSEYRRLQQSGRKLKMTEFLRSNHCCTPSIPGASDELRAAGGSSDFYRAPPPPIPGASYTKLYLTGTLFLKNYI